MARAYLPRLADTMLTDRLARMGAVVIEGAKACGKTATAQRQAASQVRSDVDEVARETAGIAPGNVLDGLPISTEGRRLIVTSLRSDLKDAMVEAIRETIAPHLLVAA